MTELAAQTPPSFEVTDYSGLSRDQLLALDALAHHLKGPGLTSAWFALRNPDLEPDHPINNGEVSDRLAETGAWWKIALDSTTEFQVQVNPRYQKARLRWIAEDGAASNSNGALGDMIGAALGTLVDRSFDHRLQ